MSCRAVWYHSLTAFVETLIGPLDPNKTLMPRAVMPCQAVYQWKLGKSHGVGRGRQRHRRLIGGAVEQVLDKSTFWGKARHAAEL